MYVILWEDSVRFTTSLKRYGNVCVCVGGGGAGEVEGLWFPGPGEYLKIWQITAVFHKYIVYCIYATYKGCIKIE